MNALTGGPQPPQPIPIGGVAHPQVSAPFGAPPLAHQFTADQLAELAARLRGERTERPSQEELAALAPDAREDELRKFYLNQHEHDEDWKARRAQQYCIRDHEGRYYYWDVYMAADPMNEERPIQELHDDALAQRQAMAQAEMESQAQAKAAREAAEERAIQARVDELAQAQRIEAEARRRFEEMREGEAQGVAADAAVRYVEAAPDTKAPPKPKPKPKPRQAAAPPKP